MKIVEHIARIAGFMLLIVTWSDPGAAEFEAPLTDGWHVWQVEASADRSGEPEGESVNIYVRMSDGKVAGIRAQIDGCPIRLETAALEHGVVGTQQSVNWLSGQIDDNPGIVDAAMAAISVHTADAALPALTAILEDRSRRQKTREQALFWLAQLPSDAAFEYLDNLLSNNLAK